MLDAKYGKKKFAKTNNGNDSFSEEESDDDDVDRVGGRSKHSLQGKRNKLYIDTYTHIHLNINCHFMHKLGGTLIICPATLLNQWNHEIETRVKYHKLNVLVHHGSNRKTSVRSMCNYDIILTTYGVVSSEEKTGVI